MSKPRTSNVSPDGQSRADKERHNKEIYAGNHLGIVIQNNDPERKGRVKIYCPNLTATVYDNWYKIARHYDTNIKKLLSWNNATKETKLFVGQLVNIEMKSPILSAGTNIKLRYVVDLGDTVKNISDGFKISRYYQNFSV